MKPHYKPLATALAATLQLAALAAVPLAWDVRPGQPAPVMFDRYHGETLSFAATFRGFGDLPFAPGADIRLWFQTNGMGSAWWSVPATIQSNVLSATWSPALDPGADRVSLFFGAPSNAYAAAVLRLRHSPGFAPGTMPDPETFHESDPVFAAWLSAFQESDPVFSSWLDGYTPPETSLEPSTNYTHSALCEFARTNEVLNAGPYLALTGGVMRADGGARIRLKGTGPALGGMQPYLELEPARLELSGQLGKGIVVYGGMGEIGFRLKFMSGEGGLFSFPEDAYATGGTLALRSDILSADLKPATNYTDRALSSFAATGTVARSITYGTPTRWTDDSGCVWEVGYRYDDDWVADSSRITQVSWTSAGYEDDPILWAIYFKVDGSIDAQAYTYPPGATQTNFTISASDWYSYYEGAFDFNIYRSPHTTTNLVGRVALTKDIPSAVSNVVTQAYAEGLGIATSNDVRDLARTFETNVVRAVITNRVYNLTPDYELGVVWRKTAGNGTFYERCYTNDTSIVEAAP